MAVHCLLLLPVCVISAGDLWLLSADDNSTLLDAVMESFRIHDRAVGAGHSRIMPFMLQPGKQQASSQDHLLAPLRAVCWLSNSWKAAQGSIIGCHPTYFTQRLELKRAENLKHPGPHTLLAAVRWMGCSCTITLYHDDAAASNPSFSRKQ